MFYLYLIHHHKSIHELKEVISVHRDLVHKVKFEPGRFPFSLTMDERRIFATFHNVYAEI